jgi:signal transduction histidine kinase
VPALPDELLNTLPIGIATVDAGGGWHAANPAMARMLGGDVVAPAALGLHAETLARLWRGEVVEHDHAGNHWTLRGHRPADGDAWVTIEDVTAAHRAASATFELARLRTMARLAATLVHDFNNLLNSAIGLCSVAELAVADPLQRELTRDLGGAVHQGAVLARTLARLLAHGIGERATVPASLLLDEALAVTAKAASQRGVRLVVTKPDAAPVVRTVVAEVVQALWQILLALLEHAPNRIGLELGLVEVVVGGGRPRPCARFRIDIAGLSATAAADCEHLVKTAPGLLPRLVKSSHASGLLVGAIILARLGGELTARRLGDDLQLDCVLPATR